MKRILVVDDSMTIVTMLRAHLEQRGYEVVTAADGRQALEQIAAQPPDIVFLDIQMPGLDGIQTLERIRKTHRNLPVIMVTAAYQDPQYFTAANRLGVSGFFPKQGTFAELARIIETSLKAHVKLKQPEA
jgi:CheY-like chemotaxis protein